MFKHDTMIEETVKQLKTRYSTGWERQWARIRAKNEHVLERKKRQWEKGPFIIGTSSWGSPAPLISLDEILEKYGL